MAYIFVGPVDVVVLLLLSAFIQHAELQSVRSVSYASVPSEPAHLPSLIVSRDL